MVGIVEAGAALSSIKTAIEMVRGVHSLKTGTDINLAIISIQQTLLDAQSAALQDREKQMELLSTIAELSKRLDARNALEQDKGRYTLTEFPTGRFAYVLKPEAANGEPSHKLCTTCFNDGKKSILQVKQKHSGGESVICPTCKEALTLSPFPPIRMDQLMEGRERRNYY